MEKKIKLVNKFNKLIRELTISLLLISYIYFNKYEIFNLTILGWRP